MNSWILSGIAFTVTAAVVLLISILVTVTCTKNADFMRDQLFDSVDPDSISTYLKNITAKPHLAGSQQDEVVLVDYVKDQFETYLDEVEVFTHKVKLSYTHSGLSDTTHKENQVYVTNKSKTKVFQANLVETNVNDGYNPVADGASDLWLAYTPAGKVTGRPIYVNFGERQDFINLCINGKAYNMNKGLCDANYSKFVETDYICIMRYGHIFRGNKIENAERFGCAGVILYNDPQQYAKDGPDKNVYPNGPYLPSTGGQRGTALLSDGDPETPGYPADPDNIFVRDIGHPNINTVKFFKLVFLNIKLVIFWEIHG